MKNLFSVNDFAAMDACLDMLRQKNDAVLLLPTETVYGLVCRFDSASGKEQIYTLKKRPKNKQLATFVPDLQTVRKLVWNIPVTAEIFAEKFCPGPLTLVIPDQENSTFGFRIPDHPFLLTLLQKFDQPLSSTSANLSGTPAALSVQQALNTLAGLPDLIIDGGEIASDSQASTVVQVFADNSWKILREGIITEQDLQKALLQN